MSKKWLVWRALAALIIIGLLVVGGLAVHYMGWSEGYAAGQLAAEAVMARRASTKRFHPVATSGGMSTR